MLQREGPLPKGSKPSSCRRESSSLRSKSSFRLQQMLQQITEGLNCMLIIFSRKQRTFRNPESPEKRCQQLRRSTELLQARKSHENMMTDPTKPLLIMRIILVLSLAINPNFLVQFASINLASWSSFQILKTPSTAMSILTTRRIPLMIIQSLTMQLQPRLKSVFSRLLPSPREITNHMRKLKTCMTQMTQLAYFRSSSFQKQRQKKICSTSLLIQISRFRIVASMKNSQKIRQYRLSRSVCASANRYSRFSSAGSLLFRSRVMARQPFQKSRSMATLMSPSSSRKRQMNMPWLQWKMVEQEVLGILSSILLQIRKQLSLNFDPSPSILIRGICKWSKISTPSLDGQERSINMQSGEFNLVAIGGQDGLFVLLLHHDLGETGLDGLLLGVGLAATGLPAVVHILAATGGLGGLGGAVAAVVRGDDETALTLL